MQDSSRPQAELLNTQLGTEGIPKTESLIEREPLHNTPLLIVKQKGKYFLALANYRVSEEILEEVVPELLRIASKQPEATMQEIGKWILYHNQWNIILNMIIAITEIDKDIKKASTAKEARQGL